MPLSPQILALVLAAAVLHAGWNALVKMGADRSLTLSIVLGSTAVVGLVAAPWLPLPAAASWPFLAGSGLLHVGYFYFLLKAYRVGDLSHVYPIARGSAPLLVAGWAWLFADEALSGNGMLGLLLASGAIASLALAGGPLRGRDMRPLAYSLSTALFISAYSVAAGMGIRVSGSPLGYIAWLLVFDAVPLLVYVWCWRRRQFSVYFQTYWKPGLAGGTMCALAYGMVVWAMSQGALAHVTALRETSVFFAAIIGARMLKEPFGIFRIIAGAVVAVGIVVMNLPI